MIVFQENQIVFVKDIGYGTLISCGSKKRIVIGHSPQLKQQLKLIDKQQLELLMIMMNGAKPQQQLEQPIQQDKTGEVNYVKVKHKKSGCIIQCPDTSLMKNIDISVKTFYNNRATIPLSIGISQTFSKIVNLITTKSQNHRSNQLYNVRLIHPCGFMHQLNLTKTIKDQQIPNNAKLIMLAQQSFSLGTNLKSSGIILSNNNLTAAVSQESYNCQTVLGTVIFSTGRHYWQVKIDRFSQQQGVYIGAANPKFNLKQHPICSANYWGFVPMCAKKFGTAIGMPPGTAMDYGVICYTGDKVGILIQYKRGEASISFFRNGMYLGQAFTGIKGPLSPVISMFIGCKQLTVDPKAIIPQCSSFINR